MTRFLPLVAALVLGLPAFGADGNAPEALEAVQKTAVEWTRLRSETSRLQANWERERALLDSAKLALDERITALAQRREETEAAAHAARTEIEALKARHAELVASVGAMEARITRLVAALQQLRPYLPPRLSAALELPYRSLGDEKLAVSERAQHALAILSRCLQFNKTITFSEEVLGDSRAAEARVAEVIYWGLAGGYAIDRSAAKAYVGQPGAGGWVWTPRDEAFDAIRHLIDVHRDRVEPEYVELPARLAEVPVPEVRP